MNNKEILDDFGKLIVAKVRDNVDQQFLKTMAGEMKSRSALTIQTDLSIFSSHQIKLIEKSILSILHDALDQFLWMIDQSDEFDLVARHGNKIVSLKEISDGLCGELVTEEGWIAKYSKYPSSEE